MRNIKAQIESQFVENESIKWDELSKEARRKIMLYNSDLMLVKVEFKQGGIGDIHAHSHTQLTYIEKGKFEVLINETQKILSAGDAFFVPSNSLHGVKCLEEGTLIDIFNPLREDFLTE